MKMIDNYITAHYDAYDDRVKVFLSRVFEDCKKNNEKLSNFFYVCLDLLATQCKMYYIALDAIDATKKLDTEDAYKRIAKSPHIQVLNKAHQQILDILDKLGLSPFASAKIKRLNNTNDDDESAEQLLKELIE